MKGNNLITMKFKALYDPSCDHFVLRKLGSKSYDCHMIHPQLIIDFDLDEHLVALEFLNTGQLRVLNPNLTKEFFKKLKEVEVVVSACEGYRAIFLSFEINGEVIQEKLPLFAFDYSMNPVVPA